MRRRRRKSALSAELNVVPYIDVMLVLLVIFMVSAPLIQQSAIDIDLPDQEALQTEEQPTPLVMPLILSIDRQGSYYLNRGKAEEALTPAQVQSITQQVLTEQAHTAVLVHGDAQVPYEIITQGILLLQQAGAKKVGLVTEEPRQP